MKQFYYTIDRYRYILKNVENAHELYEVYLFIIFMYYKDELKAKTRHEFIRGILKDYNKESFIVKNLTYNCIKTAFMELIDKYEKVEELIKGVKDEVKNQYKNNDKDHELTDPTLATKVLLLFADGYIRERIIKEPFHDSIIVKELIENVFYVKKVLIKDEKEVLIKDEKEIIAIFNFKIISDNFKIKIIDNFRTKTHLYNFFAQLSSEKNHIYISVEDKNKYDNIDLKPDDFENSDGKSNKNVVFHLFINNLFFIQHEQVNKTKDINIALTTLFNNFEEIVSTNKFFNKIKSVIGLKNYEKSEITYPVKSKTKYNMAINEIYLKYKFKRKLLGKTKDEIEIVLYEKDIDNFLEIIKNQRHSRFYSLY